MRELSGVLHLTGWALLLIVVATAVATGLLLMYVGYVVSEYRRRFGRGSFRAAMRRRRVVNSAARSRRRAGVQVGGRP